MLDSNEQWTFGGQRLEVVNYLIYLGMTLSMQLSFNRMAIDQATKAKRVHISLLNFLYNLGQRNALRNINGNSLSSCVQRISNKNGSFKFRIKPNS